MATLFFAVWIVASLAALLVIAHHQDKARRR